MVTDKKYGVLEEIGAQGRGRLMAERKWNAEVLRSQRGARRLIGSENIWNSDPAGGSRLHFLGAGGRNCREEGT